MNSTNKKTTLIQFVKFGLVGVSNSIVSLGIYSLCIYLQLHYFIANAIAFILSVLNSYFWNNRFVFQKGKGEHRNFFATLLKTYASYGVTGILIQSLLLYLFIDKFGVSKYLAQAICIVINLPLNFILNKFWSFRTTKKQEVVE